jgi:ribosomal protein S6
MRKYEVIILFDSSLSAESLAHGLSKIEEIIKKRGGSLEQKVDRGKKRLGYSIKKKKDAFVYTAIFSADEKTIQELQYDIKLLAEVLRCSVFSQEPNKKFPGNLTAVVVGAPVPLPERVLPKDEYVEEDEDVE